MAKYVMALDAGTTSNRCILFNEKGEMCSVAQKEFTQYFPQPGWVEHDANEIWSTQLGVAVEAMQKIGATAADIAAVALGMVSVYVFVSVALGRSRDKEAVSYSLLWGTGALALLLGGCGVLTVRLWLGV